jgi:hypothetical protein
MTFFSPGQSQRAHAGEIGRAAKDTLDRSGEDDEDMDDVEDQGDEDGFDEDDDNAEVPSAAKKGGGSRTPRRHGIEFLQVMAM